MGHFPIHEPAPPAMFHGPWCDCAGCRKFYPKGGVYCLCPGPKHERGEGQSCECCKGKGFVVVR